MRLIDADALHKTKIVERKQIFVDGKRRVTNLYTEVVMSVHVENAPTIDPERLRPEAEWEDGVCTACQFDLRVLTDGENGLKHWVWDEGFEYCPQCGARLKAKGGED